MHFITLHPHLRHRAGFCGYRGSFGHIEELELTRYAHRAVGDWTLDNQHAVSSISCCFCPAKFSPM